MLTVDADQEQAVINAINSQPDLLEACQQMLAAFAEIPVEAVYDYVTVEAARKSIKAAIARATGESETKPQ